MTRSLESKRIAALAVRDRVTAQIRDSQLDRLIRVGYLGIIDMEDMELFRQLCIIMLGDFQVSLAEDLENGIIDI